MRQRVGLFAAGLLATLLAWAPPVSATTVCGLDGLVAYAAEDITVSNVAIGFTLATYNASGRVPVAALVSIETNTVMVLDTGTSPTTAIGIPKTAGTEFYVCRNSIGRFKAIRKNAADATAHVIYYRAP